MGEGRLVREAIGEAGVEARVEHVADLRKIAEYGIFSTPAVVIDGKVKSVGKVLKKAEVLT